MYYLYAALGGIIPVFLISLLVGAVFLRKIAVEKKILISVAVAYFLSIILSGFGNANGGEFSPMYIEYLLSSIFVVFIRLGVCKIRKKG